METYPPVSVLSTECFEKFIRNSELVVVFLCSEYVEKEWCGLEWRAVKDIFKAREHNRVMPVRFDDAEVEGLFSTDGYIDATQYNEEQVAEYILERLASLLDIGNPSDRIGPF